MPRTLLLTALAMLAFAANSVLARLGLGGQNPDALAYTGIRLASGAVALYALARASGHPARPAGTWRAASALFGYALAFSLAYLLLGAGTGALILFATVQFGILGWAVLKGDRPTPLEWLGLVLALGGLGYLVSPGLVAPHPLGALLMIASGLCWAAYTLMGRGSKRPLADTAGNFVRCLPPGVILAAIGLASHPPQPVALLAAIASGVLASGGGYAIWYAVLPALTRTRAAIVQLTVPAIAALGGILFLGESLSLRLVIASLAILGGVALALIAADRRRRA